MVIVVPSRFSRYPMTMYCSGAAGLVVAAEEAAGGVLVLAGAAAGAAAGAFAGAAAGFCSSDCATPTSPIKAILNMPTNLDFIFAPIRPTARSRKREKQKASKTPNIQSVLAAVSACWALDVGCRMF